jgi:hypothetical protein
VAQVIFVDTGAWFATFVPSDGNGLVARRWWEDNREPLVTTDFVLDELLTLLKSRGNAQRAIALGRDLLDGSLGRLERVTEDDLHAAWLLFRAHQLSDWSFTDCTSCAVMRRLGITTVFAFDEHFREMGFDVVPEATA